MSKKPIIVEYLEYFIALPFLFLPRLFSYKLNLKVGELI